MCVRASVTKRQERGTTIAGGGTLIATLIAEEGGMNSRRGPDE
jgi:hypothetical protein